MKNITTHTGTIVDLERMQNSMNGNPRYRVVMREDSGAYITATTTPDSSVGYNIQNIRSNERVTLEIGTHYGRQQIRTLRRVAA